jgi:hypothetical protein
MNNLSLESDPSIIWKDTGVQSKDTDPDKICPDSDQDQDFPPYWLCTNI